MQNEKWKICNARQRPLRHDARSAILHFTFRILHFAFPLFPGSTCTSTSFTDGHGLAHPGLDLMGDLVALLHRHCRVHFNVHVHQVWQSPSCAPGISPPPAPRPPPPPWRGFAPAGPHWAPRPSIHPAPAAAGARHSTDDRRREQRRRVIGIHPTRPAQQADADADGRRQRSDGVGAMMPGVGLHRPALRHLRLTGGVTKHQFLHHHHPDQYVKREGPRRFARSEKLPAGVDGDAQRGAATALLTPPPPRWPPPCRGRRDDPGPAVPPPRTTARQTMMELKMSASDSIASAMRRVGMAKNCRRPACPPPAATLTPIPRKVARRLRSVRFIGTISNHVTKHGVPQFRFEPGAFRRHHAARVGNAPSSPPCSSETCENAQAYSPLLTSFSSSAVPRMPPTKFIRLLVRGSSMPKIGARMLFCSSVTSRFSIRGLSAQFHRLQPKVSAICLRK